MSEKRPARFKESDLAVWKYLDALFEQGLGAPTMREIAEATAYSTVVVTMAVDRLEARGVIQCRWRNGRRQMRGIYGCAPFTPVDYVHPHEDRRRRFEEGYRQQLASEK